MVEIACIDEKRGSYLADRNVVRSEVRAPQLSEGLSPGRGRIGTVYSQLGWVPERRNYGGSHAGVRLKHHSLSSTQVGDLEDASITLKKCILLVALAGYLVWVSNKSVAV